MRILEGTKAMFKSAALMSALRRFLLLPIAILFFFHSDALRANEISSIDFRPDGSFDPPGDVLDVSIILLSDVNVAWIEVRAYLVGKDQPDGQLPVQSNNPKTVDNENNLRLISELQRERKPIDANPPTDTTKLPESAFNSFTRRVVVPYSNLKVRPGKHRLGYEVRLVVDGKVQDASFTRLTTLTVTDNTRKTMSVNDPATVVQTVEVSADVNYWSPEEKKVITKTRMTTEQRTVLVTKTLVAEVNIQGEFRRDDIEDNENHSSRTQDVLPASKRTIYFATNREVVNRNGDIDTYFGNKSVDATDEMTFGSCVVSIPVNHIPGGLEQPGRRLIFWTEASDSKRHFVIEKFNPRRPFVELVENVKGDDILIFVHGYNNTLKSAVFRAAQIQYDIGFYDKGRVIAFSWPSVGHTLVNVSNPFDHKIPTVKTAYGADEDQAKLSHSFLAELIKKLSGELKARKSDGKIHVLAHSMGNRVVLNALHEVYALKDSKDKVSKLGYVILAAPDITGVKYSNVREALFDSCERVTFYYSPDDGALLLSQGIHVDKPIGLSATYDETRMDTINATKRTRIFNSLGHTYVMDAKPLLTDLRLLVVQGLRPEKRRPPLGPRFEDEELINNFYWTFR